MADLAIQRRNELREYLEKAKPQMLDVLPKYLTPERLVKIALVAISKTPRLLECDQRSILQCVMLGAELGLEAGGPLGHLYLVPYKNVCTPIIGYQGFVELMHRSGKIASIEAHAVHSNDEYDMKFGAELVLWHKPNLREPPKEMVFAYSVARTVAGGTQAVVMSKFEVDKIRERSRAGNNGPWVTDYEEMAKKTVVRRIAKMLPKSVQIGRAIAVDEAAERETGELQDELDMGPDVGLEPEVKDPEERAKGIKDAVARKAREPGEEG